MNRISFRKARGTRRVVATTGLVPGVAVTALIAMAAGAPAGLGARPAAAAPAKAAGGVGGDSLLSSRTGWLVGEVRGGSARRRGAPPSPTADRDGRADPQEPTEDGAVPVMCEAVSARPDPATGISQTITDVSSIEPGAIVQVWCHAADEMATGGLPTVWTGERPPMTTGQLERVGWNRIGMPATVVSPPSPRERRAGRDVWMHVTDWAERTTQVTAGDVTVSLRVWPESVRWAVADTVLTCAEPDLTWRPDRPKVIPDGCTARHRTPGTGPPEGTGVVTVTWRSETTVHRGGRKADVKTGNPYDVVTAFATPPP